MGGFRLGRLAGYARREDGYGLDLRRQRPGDLNAGLAYEFAQLLKPEIGFAARDQARHRDTGRRDQSARQHGVDHAPFFA
jgi:hypothetical protein